MSARAVILIAVFVGSFVGGCAAGGTARRDKAQASLVDDRPLVTAGPRCSGAGCRCREVDAYGHTVGDDSPEGEVPEGKKRFELRTGRGPDDVRITVEDRGSLHKAPEPIDAACGYIDLAPGDHRVRLRVKAGPGEGGSSPKLLVYEHGEKTGSWYATFGMSCGNSAVCTHGELEESIAALQKARGLFDPCGSVRVTGLRWDADKSAEERVTSLDLELVLKVYRFTPRFPRGGACKGPSPE